MLLSPFSVPSQVALIGPSFIFNGPSNYAPSFKICPFILLDFINFLEINNQHLCREILFQEKSSNKNFKL